MYKRQAQTLSFKARASTLQYRALIAYTADDFLGYKSLSASLTGFADKTLDVDTFTSVRYEGAFQITQKLSPSSSILYRYFFRRVVATNLNGTISPDEIPLYSQPTLVSGCLLYTSCLPRLRFHRIPRRNRHSVGLHSHLI